MSHRTGPVLLSTVAVLALTVGPAAAQQDVPATPVCAAQSLPDLCPAQFSPRCESCNATGHRYVMKVWKSLVEVSCSWSIESV